MVGHLDAARRRRLVAAGLAVLRGTGAVGTMTLMDEESTVLVLDALHDIRTNVRRLVRELLDEEDDGSGEEEEEA